MFINWVPATNMIRIIIAFLVAAYALYILWTLWRIFRE